MGKIRLKQYAGIITLFLVLAMFIASVSFIRGTVMNPAGPQARVTGKARIGVGTIGPGVAIAAAMATAVAATENGGVRVADNR